MEIVNQYTFRQNIGLLMDDLFRVILQSMTDKTIYVNIADKGIHSQIWSGKTQKTSTTRIISVLCW